jgi:hypothetical protein
LAKNFPPHCRLIAAQRAAGEALAGTLNEQLKPSALLPLSPAAKAALDAVMQNSKNAAAAISMVSLMIRSSQLHDIGFGRFYSIIERAPRGEEQNPARSLHKNHACIAQSGPPAGFDRGIERV